MHQPSPSLKIRSQALEDMTQPPFGVLHRFDPRHVAAAVSGQSRPLGEDVKEAT